MRSCHAGSLITRQWDVSKAIWAAQRTTSSGDLECSTPYSTIGYHSSVKKWDYRRGDALLALTNPVVCDTIDGFDMWVFSPNIDDGLDEDGASELLPLELPAPEVRVTLLEVHSRLVL